MLDSALQILLRSTILTGLTVRGYSSVLVKASRQPRQAAVPTAATVFISFMSSKRYGFPQKGQVWDSGNGVFQKTETQLYETTYQIAALSPQSAATPTAPTTDDLVRIVSNWLASDAAVAILGADQVGVLRVQDIQNLWFEDDKGQYESNPTFNIVLRHNDAFTTPVNAVQSISSGGIFPI
jgi:hypothetical protein